MSVVCWLMCVSVGVVYCLFILVVGCRLALSVVRWLLFAVRCLHRSFCCLLPAAFVVCCVSCARRRCLLCVGCSLLVYDLCALLCEVTGCCLWSVVCCGLLLVVCWLPFDVRCVFAGVGCWSVRAKWWSAFAV